MTESVTIVAGGWSVRDLDLNALPGTVIGVNDSAIRLPRCDIALSMDRLWTENRADELRGRENMSAFIRRSALKNVPTWPMLTPFECDYQTGMMSEQPGVLNGGNSGICALNLAFQIKPRRVFLCGFDMSRGPNGETYWYPNYDWAKPGGATSNGRYAEWAQQFAPAAKAFASRGIEVFNVSPASAIPVFIRISASQLRAYA